MKTTIKLSFIILTLIFFCCIVTVLPTMDDWTYITSPHTDGDLMRLLLPIASYWRPFDGLIGYINGLYPQMFPYSNHVLIICGHAINTWLILRLARHLDLSKDSQLLGACFFLIAPAMLGATIDIDSANQVYSLTFGLLATHCYLSKRITMAALSIFISILWKENGAAFTFVCPLLAYGLKKIDEKTFVKHFLLLALVIVVYLIVRFSLPQDNVDISSEYVDGGLHQLLHNVGVFLVFTWLPLDFVSIVHAPSRNLLLGGVTILLSLPFAIVMMKGCAHRIKDRMIICLAVAMLAIASIHIVTIFSSMHTYSSLSMASLIVAIVADHEKRWRYLVISTWMAAATISNTHHLYAAYLSGESGRLMAQNVAKAMQQPADSIYFIFIDHHTPKYSTFCTIPHEAFGSGIALQQANLYKWPERIDNTLIEEDQVGSIPTIAKQAFAEGFESVVVVESESLIYELLPADQAVKE